MSIKSIGTLAAKLLVDTKGWFAGFQKADKQAQGFTQRAERQFKAFNRAFSRTALLGGGLFAAKRAADAFVNSLARVEKNAGLLDAAKDAAQAAAAIDRMGLGISTIDQEHMARLVQKLREAQSVLIAIGDHIVSDLTPAVDSFVTQWLVGLESIKNESEITGRSGIFKFLKGAGEGAFGGAFGAIAKVLGVKPKELEQGLKDQARDADKFRSNARAAAPPAAVDPAKPGPGPRPLSGTQSPFERGTTAAAVAVLEMKGNPIHTVAKNTADMLTELKAMRAEAKKQPQKIGQARINK